MNRRSFIRGASLIPIPLFLGRSPLAALSSPFTRVPVDNDRIMVIVQLDGGNDGLNMVIPVDQYGELKKLRPNIMIPQNKILKLEDGIGLNPVMPGLHNMYKEGNLTVVQGVAYPNQNRSHFRSGDIWATASPANKVITTGWLGRHIDQRYPNSPDTYPDAESPTPYALVIGNNVSETCQGKINNYSIAVNNIDRVGQLPIYDQGAKIDTPYGRELDWLRDTKLQSNRYAATITDAANLSNSMADYPEDNQLAGKLRSVARLISGGLQTKIYVVQLGGFDTHAAQVETSDTTKGRHAELLGTVSSAIAAFYADLKAQGLDERVVGFTFSEFGRQIKSNGADGTDHGEAAPMLLFGSCLNSGIIGENLQVDPETEKGKGVPWQFDFRNVYGSLLMDWFGVEEFEARQLLMEGFEYMPLVNVCNDSTSSTDPGSLIEPKLSAYPNPFHDQFQLTFRSENEPVNVGLYNGLGQKVRTIMDRTLPAGDHQLPVATNDLPAGIYYVRVALSGGLQRSIQVVKQ